jgi:hypothetical protein
MHLGRYLLLQLGVHFESDLLAVPGGTYLVARFLCDLLNRSGIFGASRFPERMESWQARAGFPPRSGTVRFGLTWGTARVSLAVGGDAIDCREDRMCRGDAPQSGSSSRAWRCRPRVARPQDIRSPLFASSFRSTWLYPGARAGRLAGARA